jgi:hypothetical protein
MRGSISACVRRVDRELFILALAAQNLLFVRSWPSEDGGVLWAPADEDLPSAPGILQLEATDDLQQWRDLLGNPPQDVNLMGVLYLANLAAVAQLGGFESPPNQPGLARESQEQLDRMEGILEKIQNSQLEALQRQDALIDELVRMADHMQSTDRYACEQSLLAELSNVWGKLEPEVRSCMLASEQMYRTPNFAAPAKLIDGLATAFERQLLHSVISLLFDHLRRRKEKDLRPMPEWQDAEHRDRPLWSPAARAEKCTLGAARLILRHPSLAVGEFFDQFGFDRAAIRGAIEAVCRHRNPAVHGSCFDIGTAGAIRADWLSWEGRVGGVYSVFFRAE